jgi:hypothetical protein
VGSNPAIPTILKSPAPSEVIEFLQNFALKSVLRIGLFMPWACLPLLRLVRVE